MAVVKIVTVLGTSEESWEDAAREAVRRASETIDDLHGVEIEDYTAQVENGEIVEYRATVNLSFPIHRELG